LILGIDAEVEFFQPSTTAAVLNRVHDGDVTGIMGNLNANGRVFVINPAGIVFGESAVINVSQLVASSLTLEDADFLNGAPYTFAGGADAGEVINRSLDTITADSIYLIGKTVINTGSLVAIDGYVVMAAGETVTINENGSNVTVEVLIPEPLPDEVDSPYWVDHGEDGSGGSINAQHVILAAGDVWTSAYINASSENNSDAVASVEITAFGDIEIDDEIIAEAEATGGGDNAFATVTIESTGGNVDIDALVKAEADAEDGAGNAIATVDIIADGDVYIDDGAEGEDVQADAWVDGDSGHGEAIVNITAGGNVDIYGEVKAEADTRDGSGDAIAKVEIDAGGDVYVGDNVKARAEAVDSGNATSDNKITGEYIEIDDKIVARAITNDNTVNTGDAESNIEITARGDLDIYSDIKSKASSVEAGDVTSDIKIFGVDINIDSMITSRTQAGYIDIDDYSDYSGNSGDATSGVDIAASGIVTVNDRVKSYAEAGDNSGSASATTKIVGTEIDIDDGGGDNEDSSVMAMAHTWENSGNATANVEIEATTGDVLIDSGGYPVIAEAEVEDPDTEYTGDATAGVTITAAGDVETWDLIKAEADAEDDAGDATATVDITADGSVIIHDGEYDEYMVQSDVWVSENSGSGESTLNITALGGDVDIYGNVKSEAETSDNSGDAAATLDIAASGNVNIYDNEDDTIKARASVDNPDTEYEGDATATLNITAGGDVLVEDNVEVEAETYGAGDATATVTVDAGGDLTIDEEGEIYADADAQNNSGDATALVDIDAENVTVDGDGKIDAVASTDEYSGDASATVDIDATGDVTVNGSGDIYAEAYAQNYSGSATALVDIDAENVTVNEHGYIYVYAETDDDSGDATATVDIDAGGNVGVYGNGYLYAEVDADEGSGDATATVDIDAGGDVDVVGGDEGEGHIYAEADTDEDSGDATADVDIEASNVTVNDGEMFADAETDDGSGNATATIDITLTSSDVLVENDSDIYAYAGSNNYSDDAEATVTINNAENVTVSDGGEIYAETEVDNDGGPEGSSSSATSVVDIDATGDVIVGEDGEIYADADVDNYDDWQINTFTGNADADVYITSTGEVIVDGLVKAEADVYNKDGYEQICSDGSFDGDIYSGNSYANVMIDNILGLGVTVGSDGEIIADSAFINYDYPDQRLEDNVYSGEAFAGIDIATCGDVIVDGLVNSMAFIDPIGTYDADYTNDDYSQTMVADVIVKAFGDVIINSNGGSNGQIEALAFDGAENSAAITILAVGDVIVNNGSDTGHPRPFLNSREEIRAAAFNGSTNNADVRIATREGFGGDVEISGQIGARTWIEGQGGSSNTSTVEIFAAQDLIVNGGYALYADGDGPVLLDSHEGGQITAAARNGAFNTANVEIYADRDVIVHGAEIDFTGELPQQGQLLLNGNGGGLHDGGQILALTYGSQRQKGDEDLDENTSSIGIYAQGDVTINDATIIGDPLDIDNGGPPNRTSDGQVLAGAHGLQSINDADIEIAGQADVTIDGEVIAEAGTDQHPLNEHYADIRIWAGGQLGGSGRIYAEADEVADISEASVTFFVTGLGNLVFDGEAYSWDGDEIDEDHIVIVGPVDVPENDFEWIDWTWCEDCEEEAEALFAPAAPLVPFETPRIEGCPQLIQAAATELGITGETIQIGIGNALALNPGIQACQACASLINAAGILRDEDGSRMAAMVQAFNEQAPADAPFTPEMATSIAMTFEGAAEGTQYASVMEYIDAFVQYAAVLDTGLGSPVGDSVAFVMEKYGSGITDSDNGNIAAFIITRLETIGQ